MKTIKTVVILLFCLVGLLVIDAEDNYWKIIKEGYKVRDVNEALRIKDYIESLTPEQLFIAGHQCAEEINDNYEEKGFAGGAGWLIAFFITQYPQKADMNDISSILSIIENPNETNCWRAALIYSLHERNWFEKLNTDQVYSIITALKGILSEKNEFYMLQMESIATIKNNLAELEKRNVLAEPNLCKELDKGLKYSALLEMLKNKEIDTSGRYKNERDKILNYYIEFSNKLKSVIEDDQRNSTVKVRALAFLWRDCLGKDIDLTNDIRVYLSNAVRNYKKYDYKIWFYLAKIGWDTLDTTEALNISQEVAEEAQKKLDEESDLRHKVNFQGRLKFLREEIKRKNKETSKIHNNN